MRTIENYTVADELNRNMKTSEIFRKFGIDYCCKGELPVKMAAEEAMANIVSLSKELKEIEAIKPGTPKMELYELVDHLIKEQNALMQEAVPVIVHFAHRVLQKNAETYPELIQVQRLFSEIVNSLEPQLKSKHTVLYPCIKKVKNEFDKGRFSSAVFEQLKERIQERTEEHREMAYKIKQIVFLTADFQLPENARNPFRILYEQLSEFEQKLYHLLHLENNILYPGIRQWA